MNISTPTAPRGLLPTRILCALLLPLGLCLSLLCISAAPAHAQGKAAKKKATKYFKSGRTKFKLGDFDEAIRLFKLAYETSPHHAFLFNLGQAYRQKGDCKQAIFFYKGYLTEAGKKAKNRKLVEGHIAELTEICKATDDSKDKPPNDIDEPEGDGTGAGDSTGDGNGNGDGTQVAAVDSGPSGADLSAGSNTSGGDISTTMEPWQPSVLTSTLVLGPSLINFGADLDGEGVRPAFGISAGYPMTFGNLGVSVGGMFTYASIPDTLNGEGGSPALMSAIFNIGLRYWLFDKLALGADLGGGALFLSGLAEDNMFIDPGDMVTGTLAMPNLRVAVALDYLISKNLTISAAPFIYSTSPPKAGLSEAIDAFTRMEFMLGIGYRM